MYDSALCDLVFIFLSQIGFFRRKRVEELKKMQHKGELEKMMPDEAEEKDASKTWVTN